jgi:hypothetical protein
MKINKILLIIIYSAYFVGGIIIYTRLFDIISSIRYTMANSFIEKIAFKEIMRIIFYSILYINSCLVLSQLLLLIKVKFNNLLGILHLIFHFSSIFIYIIYFEDMIFFIIILLLIGITTVIPIIIYHLNGLKKNNWNKKEVILIFPFIILITLYIIILNKLLIKGFFKYYSIILVIMIIIYSLINIIIMNKIDKSKRHST